MTARVETDGSLLPPAALRAARVGYAVSCARCSLGQEEFVFARARTRHFGKVTVPSPIVMQTFSSPEHSMAVPRQPQWALAGGWLDTLFARLTRPRPTGPSERLAILPPGGFESVVGNYPLTKAAQEVKPRHATNVARRAGQKAGEVVG